MARRLSYHRDVAGLSPEDVATITGEGARTVRYWEDESKPGSIPRADTLAILCRVYGVTSDYILRPVENSDSSAYVVATDIAHRQLSSVSTEDNAWKEDTFFNVTEHCRTVYSQREVWELDTKIQSHYRSLVEGDDDGKGEGE